MDSASMVLGILSIFLWPIPLGGVLIGATALSLGLLSLRRGKSALALAGTVLAGAALAVTLLNWRIGLMDLILRQYFQQ